MNNLISIGKCS